MPNLSPADVRTKYAIYSGKASFGTQAVEGIKALERELSAINYTINYSKADYNDSI
jgi:biotin synthase